MARALGGAAFAAPATVRVGASAGGRCVCAHGRRPRVRMAARPVGGGARAGDAAGAPQPPPEHRHQPNAPRTKIGLLRAMLRGRVASRETCEMLLRVGHVRVNGLVKEDASMRVDLEADVITVSGKDLVFEQLDGVGGTSHINDFDETVEDEAVLTRAQRDFRKGKFGEKSRAPKDKKYSRRIDGGVLSRRRWVAGK